MNNRLIDRVVAWSVFIYALIIYLLTVSPTASFWDAGEFIAIASRLQVSHPPGAPFYMLVGRLFSMFVPTDYIALAVNLVSVLASAFTVLLTHLIIVRLVRIWQTEEEIEGFGARLSALAGGVIGATTFAVTDSFWFNAVEAEVYAMSMLFTAIVVWLILKWNEEARYEELALGGGGRHPFSLSANRYLIVIAYLFGIAIGVHLLNLLAVFFIALIVFFSEFERPNWTRGQLWIGIILSGLVSSIIFLFVYPGIVQWLPEIAGISGTPILFVIGLIGLVVFAIYYTHRHHMQVANLVVLCAATILIGYSTYGVIFIRSAADPPIDENDPENTEDIVSYLKREQYGQTPILKGASYDNLTGQIDETKTKLFPRRYSPSPEHIQLYAQYDSDLDFFLKYQVGHMYVRYFLWNFVGKASDEQDAPAITGLLPGETKDVIYQTPSERASRNAYYALPLLLGLIGAGFHFNRDWRRALSVLILFLVTGIGIIIYLNQTPYQPRERDYSYVASFFAFALWVGIGATGLLEVLADVTRKKLGDGAQKGLLFVVAGILFLAVPFHMLIVNFHDHDRSGNYVAPEYAYNMLMSLEKNAIVFTNGDNDTFPLWYAQEVEGLRQDVRVVNLSLLNTPWYIKQLKNQASRDSKPLPISLSDQQIENIAPVGFQPRDITLPVDKKKITGASEVAFQAVDTTEIQSPMTWRLDGRRFNAEMNWLHVADQVALNILQTNAEQGWKRPVYFAVTVSQDGQLDLQNYFQLEGQAFRVVPVEHNVPLGRVVPSLIQERLKRFKFTNLNDPDVYYDENIRRMVDNYRNVFAHVSEELSAQGYQKEAKGLLDTMLVNIPFNIIPGDERSFFYIARAYQQAGAVDQSVRTWKLAEPVVLNRLKAARNNRDMEYATQFVQIMRMSYLEAKDFAAAAEFSNKLADILKDDSLRKTAAELQKEYAQTISQRTDSSAQQNRRTEQ